MSDETKATLVFKALADPTRRHLLDRLRERDGQSLFQLCERVRMTRQSATGHLDVLARAGLITIVRRGRVRLHYLNPAPLHEIGQRWLAEFGQPRPDSSPKAEATGTYVYVSYIRASPEQVWHALTDANLTARFSDYAHVPEAKPGSAWERWRTGAAGVADITGEVITADPPARLVITFPGPRAKPPREPSVVTFDVEPHRDIVRLTVTHDKLAGRAELEAVSHTWPAVLANLKTLLETGDVLP